MSASASSRDRLLPSPVDIRPVHRSAEDTPVCPDMPRDQQEETGRNRKKQAHRGQREGAHDAGRGERASSEIVVQCKPRFDQRGHLWIVDITFKDRQARALFGENQSLLLGSNNSKAATTSATSQ